MSFWRIRWVDHSFALGRGNDERLTNVHDHEILVTEIAEIT